MPISKKTRVSMQIRVPVDVRDWLAARASHFGSSMNAEIVRAIRQRMEGEQRED
jgi:Arc-like DNA binding domain